MDDETKDAIRNLGETVLEMTDSYKELTTIVFDSLERYNSSLEKLWSTFGAVIPTLAELDPRFHETFNNWLRLSKSEPLSEHIEKLKSHLAALKKRGGQGIQ
jgi:hypothetical protein